MNPNRDQLLKLSPAVRCLITSFLSRQGTEDAVGDSVRTDTQKFAVSELGYIP